MNRLLLSFFGGSLLLLSACGTEDGGPGTISTTAPAALLSGVNGVEALFAPSSDPAVPSVLPAPNNAAFAGSTDGTLNIPVADPTNLSDPTIALNELDGFSTVAPISTGFGEALDPATVSQGVYIFDTSTSVPSKLTFGVDYVALASPSDATVLVIKPIKPLKGATNYLVVVSNSLKSVSGKPAVPSKVFNLMKSTVPLVDASGISQVPGVPNASAVGLEGLRQTVKPALDTAAAFGVNKADVAVAWSFKTQSIGQVLPEILLDTATNPYANSGANFATVPLAPSPATGGLGILSGANFATVNGLPPAAVANIGSVVIGAIPQMPYYLDAYSAANPVGPVTGRFAFNTGSVLPVTKSLEAVPFLLTVPNTAGPWKVAIFQHGFTVDKTAMFGIANTLAQAGFATIAIDAVLHGSRTFNLDLVNNTSGAPGPDGIVDSSGQHYLNLSSLLTSRDNIRQSVADLIHLTQLLKVQTMDIVSNTTGLPGGGDGADLDVAVPFVFVGHSNGGILGTVLAGVMPATTISRYVVANPGGDYASILQNSGAFGPVVDAGLAAKGIVKDSAEYNKFFFAAQTVVDDGDPLNYAAVAATNSMFLLKTTPDGVVPNAQTDTLALNLGLKQVSGNPATVTANAWPLTVVAPPLTTNGFVNYTAGTHSSFLSPTASLPATTAMQTDTATFLLSGAITTSNTAITE